MSLASYNRSRIRYIALTFVCLILPGIVRSQFKFSPVADPPGLHLVLRLEGSKTAYMLGDSIMLEVAWYSDLPGRYSSACVNDTNGTLTPAEVVALDSKSQVAVDPPETRWIGRTLCPFAQYPLSSDILTGQPEVIAVGAEAHWQKFALTEHYPMSGGRFRIRVSTTGHLLSKNQEFTASSAPVEIDVVDDPQSRAAILRDAVRATKALDPFTTPATTYDEAGYWKVQFMPDLDALRWMISEGGYGREAAQHPNRAAMAKFLHEYLDTKVSNDIRLKENVEALLALELASSSPKLYARAVAFQDAVGEPSRRDVRDLRAWLLPRYRQLMMEIARSMVTTHKETPGSFEDDNMEFKAEELVDLNLHQCSGVPNFLSEDELRDFMREAGTNSDFIDEQIAKMREARRMRVKQSE
jgi:hypothetical protein